MNNVFSKNLLAAIVFVALIGMMQSCTSENDNLLVEQLTEEKANLLASIDSLQMEYDDMYTRMVNSSDTLNASFQNANAKMAEQEQMVKKLAKQVNIANVSADKLKAEVEQLKTSKQEYEVVIEKMRNEIIRLNKDNTNLRNNLDASADLNEALTYEIEELKLLVRGMEAELDQRRIDGVKAANVRFEVQKKGDKPTASNNRARTVIMDFDLNKVPNLARGETQMYLVIRDAKTGVPIRSNNPIKAVIKPKNGKQFTFIAQEARTITLGENQRIQMRHDLETRLAKGSYRAAVYSDLGLLGAVSFRLR